MEISIVIVNWNSTTALLDCLESINENIDDIEYEVIVADNNSSDCVPEALRREFPWVNFIFNERNLGYSKANNKCIDAAKGEFILFLNPDIKLAPSCAKSMLEFLKKREDAGAVSGRFLNEDRSLQRFYRKFPTIVYMIFHATILSKLFPNNRFSSEYEYRHEKFEEITEVDQPGTSLFMIRRRLFSDLGGFDEKMPIFFNDADLCKRIRDKGYKIFVLPDAKAYHLLGESIKKEKPEVIILEGALSMVAYLGKHQSRLQAATMKTIILIDQIMRFLYGLILHIFRRQPRENFDYRLKVFFHLLINKKLITYG